MSVLPELSEREYVNDELVVDLRWRGLKLLQKRQFFGFTDDSLALAQFVGGRPGLRQIGDLGCGSGGLLLLLWAQNPQAQCTGLEIMPANVRLAQRSLQLNAHLPELPQHCRFLQGDWRTPELYFAPASFDLLASNPPYWPPKSGRRSPVLERAAARQELFGDLSQLIHSAAWLLRPGGRLALVLPQARQAEAEQFLTAASFNLLRFNLNQRPGKLLLEAEKI